MNEDKAVVDELNRIRLDENLSYATLAAEIGMDPSGLQNILKGRVDPYDRTLHKLRRYLERREPTATAPVLPKRKAAAR